MLCKEVMDVIEEAYPADYAMDWDNVGQLLGDPAAEVTTVLLALDITEAVADEAIAQG